MKNFKRKAFTLVELLVVIAIIGILFVVLISKVDFATEKAKASGVQTDFRSYQLAIETVARENAGLSTLVDDDASGEEKYAALEAALNKNLDPKLRVEIDENGKISTEAKDPWKEQYLGVYLAPDADGTVKDRGAIVIYSKGSNLKLGTASETANGVVNVTVESGKEKEGADDYSISTIYTYINGYGEIKTTTDGFSNDIEDGGVNQGDDAPVSPGEPSDPADPDTPDQPTDPDTPNTPDNPEQGGVQEPNYPAASEGLAYTLKDDNTYEVSGIGTCTDTDILIPAEVDGVAVTSIGYGAFRVDSTITSITIPNSVTSIGEVAFAGCSGLTSIDIPDSVATIYKMAFAGCSGLTSITIPNSVTTIGESAFMNCSGLTSITIPNSVISIGHGAFDSCSGLTSIDVDNDNAAYQSIDGNVYSKSGDTLVAYAIGKPETSFTISDSVTTIGGCAFAGCTNLTSITIPNSVTSIGGLAFSGCTGINNITFKGTMQQWGTITLGYSWNRNVPAIYVQCFDGRVAP